MGGGERVRKVERRSKKKRCALQLNFGNCSSFAQRGTVKVADERPRREDGIRQPFEPRIAASEREFYIFIAQIIR